MAKKFTWLSLIAIVAVSVGCSICCGPDDYNYGAYGGLHPREDMQHGRVGSIFSDPNGSAIRLTPHMEVAENVTPENPTTPKSNTPDELPKPGTNKGKSKGSDSKGIDTRRRRTPSRFRSTRGRKRVSQQNPQRPTPSSRPRHWTASILGGQRVR